MAARTIYTEIMLKVQSDCPSIYQCVKIVDLQLTCYFFLNNKKGLVPGFVKTAINSVPSTVAAQPLTQLCEMHIADNSSNKLPEQ